MATINMGMYPGKNMITVMVDEVVERYNASEDKDVHHERISVNSGREYPLRCTEIVIKNNVLYVTHNNNVDRYLNNRMEFELPLTQFKNELLYVEIGNLLRNCNDKKS